VVQVRSVTRRVLASAKRDLADRSETLHCGLFVFHSQSPPRNGECRLSPAVGQTWPDRNIGSAICVPQRTPLLSSSRGTRPSLLAPTLGVLTIAASLVLAQSAGFGSM
jgi:hypothetical protein